MTRFDSERSFTSLNWLVVEKIKIDTNFDLENINDQTACELCFNIFPHGHGILHKLALGSNDPNKTDDQIKAAEFTKKLFEKAK